MTQSRFKKTARADGAYRGSIPRPCIITTKGGWK
nr:MAG TPA: hypothetical protein [Caudoviricetes sp.]